MSETDLTNVSNLKFDGNGSGSAFPSAEPLSAAVPKQFRLSPKCISSKEYDMARHTQHEWFSLQRFASRRRNPRRGSGTQPFRRRLRIEPLEERRLLALVTVDTLDDTVDFNDGVTSLREALFATNLVGGADTIDFAASLTSGGPATLTLTQGELAITDALTINGPGADLLTIDASGNDPTPDSTIDDDDFSDDFDGSRVFNIDDGNFTADKSVSIFGLTLTGGDVYGSGGAIYSRAENLTITGSTISGNSATFGGGILTTNSDLTVTDSTISGNSAASGGGINSGGDYISLTVTNSTISGNSGGEHGGGISSSGYFSNVTVTGSTISGNLARFGSGGGISVRGYQNTLTVNDSTISGNSAGGTYGGGISGGIVTVTDSTISGNSTSRYGGGISGSDITVTDSTISDNSALEGQFSRGGGISGGIVTVTDSTISGNATSGRGGGIGGGNVTVSGSRISDNSASGFEYYNGGGGVFGHSTLTLSDSTIIGNSAANGGGLECRYGALTVTNSTISGNSASENGGGIKGRYVTVVNSTISGNSAHGRGGGIDNVTGDSMVTGSTIIHNSAGTSGGGIQSFDNLTVIDTAISGNSAGTSGGGIQSRYGVLTLTGTTISDNSAGASGGGIYSILGNLTVIDSTINGNSAVDSGGGIYSFNGNVTVTGSTISDNSTSFNGSGGGIFSDREIDADGNVTVIDSTISENSAGFAAGGIFSGRGALTVTDSMISSNSADGPGGGIFSTSGAVTTVDSTVSGNSAGWGGGGIASQEGRVTVTDSTVSGNSANGDLAERGGGGINNNRGDVIVTHSTISGNVANVNGGGIYSRSGEVTIVDSTVSGNSSDHSTPRYGYGGGGGIFNGFGRVTVTGSRISSNSSVGSDGGGIGTPGGTLTVTNSTISFNSADDDGGGIYGGNVTVTGSTINNNYADGSGGGLGLVGGSATVSNSTISDNSADGDGGGIFSRFGRVTMTGSTLSGNLARDNGGGLYVFNASNLASAIRHSTVTGNTAVNGGGGAFIFGGKLALDHTILAANVATFGSIGPDLTGVIGTTFDVRFSLIGNNAHSGLAATPTGTPDANGNLIGPVVSVEPLLVYLDMAAMGDFEAGTGGDSFLFEYSIDGGAFQPLFTSSVDEAASQTYFMDNGTQVVRDDPLSVNDVVLNNEFQSVLAEIPVGGGQIRIRFTATNDGPNEVFAWRHLYVEGQNSSLLAGAAVQFDASSDRFAAYAADPDYTIAGDMFGIRTRANPGIPGLPSDITDESTSNFPGDTQGIIGPLYAGQFFGVVDTANGVGNDTDTATWTFNNILVPLDPKLGPLADNGGPTQTHALLAGSPAIDAGDPAAVAGVGTVPTYDQRGAPFGRLLGARTDMGSIELPPVPPPLLGDYNQDGEVGAADYTLWRDTLGQTGLAHYSGADGNGDGMVTRLDYDVWRAHFGQTLPLLGMGSVASIVTPSAEPVTVAGAARSEETSVSLHRSEPNQAVEVLGSSGEEQAASQRKNPLPVLVVPAPLLASSPPAVRVSPGPTATLAASRRDDALLAWLALPESKQEFEDGGQTDTWENDEASSTSDLHFNSVDELFALLARG